MEDGKCKTCGFITGITLLVGGIIFIVLVNIWSIVELANHWNEFGDNCLEMRSMMLAYIIISFLGISNGKTKDEKVKLISLLIWYGVMSICLGIFYVGNYPNQQCMDFITSNNIYWLSLSQFILVTIIATFSLIATILLVYFDKN
tara:strand:- start:423 stop:857 length:435 start_codon:yes stop_codon:yes gene_type:complete